MSEKIVILTGAAVPGYGQAITKRFLSDGYSVIGTCFREDQKEASEFAESLPGLTIHPVDLFKREDLESFVGEVGTQEIDSLVFAQMFWNMEDPENFDHDLWDKSIATNLTAVNFLVHELKGSIKDGGSIVVIPSTEGFVGSFGGTAYAAARAGEHNLVQSFANNLGARNIRVNALAPGWIGSVMDTDEIFDVSREYTPLGRLGDGDEVASAVAFLASSEASFVNGTTLVADGGYSGVDYMARYEFRNS